MGYHDADGAIVESAQHMAGVSLGNTYQSRYVIGFAGQQRMVQRASIPRGMFLVEDDEIETLEAKYLTILGRRHLHESAEHRFA